MILILGLFLSLGIFPLIGLIHNQFITRSAILLIISYLLFLLFIPFTSISYLDGTLISNNITLLFEFFLCFILLLYLPFAQPPYYILLIMLSNIIGIIYLIMSNDFVITILTWELFNISLYLIVASRASESSLSAAIQYFLLSALSTGFLLFGIALLYSMTGSTHIDDLIIMNHYIKYWPMIFIVISLLFKLAAAPLHQWAPVLYSALPTHLTIWMMLIPKIAVLGFLVMLGNLLADTKFLLEFCAALSILIGSIGLASQYQFIRFMTFSTISNVGFLLLPIISNSFDLLYYYLVIYILTTLMIFLIILSLPKTIKFTIELSGLSSIPLTIAFFSLAGIPPLAGFYAKLLVISSIFSSSFFLALIAIIGSAISTANYLTIIKTIHIDKPFTLLIPNISPSLSYIIAAISILLIIFMFKAHVILSLISAL